MYVSPLSAILELTQASRKCFWGYAYLLVCILILVCTNVDDVSLHNDEDPKVEGDGTIYLRRDLHDLTIRPSSFDGLVVNPCVLVVSTFVHTRIKRDHCSDKKTTIYF